MYEFTRCWGRQREPLGAEKRRSRRSHGRSRRVNDAVRVHDSSRAGVSFKDVSSCPHLAEGKCPMPFFSFHPSERDATCTRRMLPLSIERACLDLTGASFLTVFMSFGCYMIRYTRKGAKKNERRSARRQYAKIIFASRVKIIHGDNKISAHLRSYTHDRSMM